MTESGLICLYFGNPEECQNCGGWVKAEDGPFLPDNRYCSQDCFEDAKERSAREAERLKCCIECGYDCGEHDLTCSISHAATAE